MAELEDVKRRLEIAVERSRVRVGAALTEDGQKLIDAYVARIAGELAASGQTDDFDRAVRAFDDLLFRATYRTEGPKRNAPSSQRRGRRTVTDGQLRSVLDQLCPGFWPFC